jgi:hypothetical protein
VLKVAGAHEVDKLPVATYVFAALVQHSRKNCSINGKIPRDSLNVCPNLNWCDVRSKIQTQTGMEELFNIRSRNFERLDYWCLCEFTMDED